MQGVKEGMIADIALHGQTRRHVTVDHALQNAKMEGASADNNCICKLACQPKEETGSNICNGLFQAV